MSGRVGFSSRINDPAFDKYRSDQKRWSLLFSVGLFAVAVIAFPVYGAVSGEMEMPYSLYYGLGIGGMFVAIALVQTIARERDATWDGTVVDKRVFKRQRVDKDNDTMSTVTIYEVKIKRDDGKVVAQRNENTDVLYQYYHVGDRVRHHRGLAGYEKYDKSRDSIVFCAACATINSINEEYCHRCKCPLLT